MIKVNSMASFYRDNDYKLILKHQSAPYSLKRADEVLCNIFRIVALHEMEQPEWRAEFDYLTENNMLKAFNPDTERYLQIYLTNRLSINHLWLNNHKIDILNVPTVIQKNFLIGDFPINT